MPIETPHPLYSDNLAKWARCRHAYDGEDAVKAGGDTYLPRIDPSQTTAEYEAYKKRALYYEAVGRTVQGFVGAMSRKQHVIKLPTKLAPFEADATADGVGLNDFIRKTCGENLLQGRAGILVDYDEAQARPFFRLYVTESILSWSADSVVLSESLFEPDPDDRHKQVPVEQLRQLHLVDGAYTVTLWRKAKSDAVAPGSAWIVVDELRPVLRGRPFDTLPWYWLSPVGQTSAIEKPPLLGLVNLSMSHYRSSADLEHGRHFTALPTLWVSGATQDAEIRVGAGAVIQLSDPAARVGYAEFTGQGLGSLENALVTKEAQMAVLGAQIFGVEKKGVEAADTARIRTSGENSILQAVVSSVEEVLVDAFKCAEQWLGVTDSVEIQLNRDFVDQSLDAQTLAGMVAAVQAGAMSIEAFTYCLSQAEMLPPGVEVETEAAQLRAAMDAKAKAALASAKPPVPPSD